MSDDIRGEIARREQELETKLQELDALRNALRVLNGKTDRDDGLRPVCVAGETVLLTEEQSKIVTAVTTRRRVHRVDLLPLFDAKTNRLDLALAMTNVRLRAHGMQIRGRTSTGLHLERTVA